MRLCDHEDFQTAITNTAADRHLPEDVVEKDYYITEALRIVADAYDDKIIFKGGTSLSKGFDLIRRLSEDVDLLVEGENFNPRLSRTTSAKELVKMRDMIGEHPGLTYDDESSFDYDSGRVRCDYFNYESKLASSNLNPTVIFEPGCLAGGHPSEVRPISSYVGDYLIQRESGDMADDLAPFDVHCLHYKRTFVEKMFIVHALAEEMRENDTPFGRDARHYYDLYILAGQDDVRRMMRDEELDGLKADCAAISEKRFAKSYNPPVDLSFKDSIGLFPPDQMADVLATQFEEQCDLLCHGSVPTFQQVLDRFKEIRTWL